MGIFSRTVSITDAEIGLHFTNCNADDQAEFLGGMVSGLVSGNMSAYEWSLQSSSIAESEMFVGGNGPEIKKLAATMLRVLADHLEAK